MQLAPKEDHCHIHLPHFNLRISLSRNSVYIFCHSRLSKHVLFTSCDQ